MSFRRLSLIVEELSKCVEQGMPILIEGKKDEEALKQLVFEVLENRSLQTSGLSMENFQTFGLKCKAESFANSISLPRKQVFEGSKISDFETFSKTLKEQDINFNIIKVSGSGLKLFEIAEMAAQSSSKVIILTDFDKKGNILAKKLSNDIQSLGSHPDLSIRKRIMRITRKYIKDIESLPKHMKQLELEINPYGNYQ